MDPPLLPWERFDRSYRGRSGGSGQSLVEPERIVDKVGAFEALGLVKNGKPRLVYAQSYFTQEGKELEKRLLTDLYLYWSGLTEYLIFEAEHRHTGAKKWRAAKSAKRGNDVYRRRLRRRLSFINELEEVEFFSIKSRGREKTRALFVTLTYDVKIADLLEAWGGVKEQRVSKDGRVYYSHKKGCLCVSCLWNRYITNLRMKFGRISVIRVWEGYKTGYPHIHAILIFHDHEFECFRHNGVWRVQGKHEDLETYGGGYVDVEALGSIKGGIRYVVKYLNKIHKALGAGEVEGPQDADDYYPPVLSFVEAVNHGAFTMALMWLFRKRAFAVSGDFIDLIRRMHNSKSAVSGEVDLVGDPVWVWRLRGFYVGRLPGVDGVPWSVELDLVAFRELKASGGYSDRAA